MLLNKFINRTFELEFLEEKYKSNKFEFIPIYGRRRVGKTALIKEFLKNKDGFYFLAQKEPIKIEIKRFIEKFSKENDTYFENNIETFENLFENLTKKIKTNKKYIIVIDEFPYLIEQEKSITAKFQYIIDEILSNFNIMLIICGSMQSIMENKVLAEKSPLYGRRTGQLNLKQLSFKHFSKFFPNEKIETLIKNYSVLDGIPYYINEFKENSFIKNLENTFLNKANILYQEGRFLLQEELREINTYLNILISIQEGKTKLNEISQRSLVNITNVPKYLDVLVKLKLLRKEIPFNENLSSRKYIYKISDNYYKFWIKYIYPFQDYLEFGDKKIVLNKIKQDLDRNLEQIFEDISKQYMQEVLKLNTISPWWHKENEIDLIGLNIDKEIYFAECKYKNTKVTLKVLKNLIEKSNLVNYQSKTKNYIIFSKSGFSNDLIKYSKENSNITLISLNEIKNWINN